ncbi:hypothetical protein PF003_g33317 [Phytophthora fragariae]|nr:hypothetical protein PF003_g33317 [Phytophthora fragariae]
MHLSVTYGPVSSVPDSPPCGPSATEQPDPASPASVEHTTERAVPETTHSETAGTVTAARLPDIPGSIPFDEFDSENFLDALRRDQLFAPTDGDDLNIGRDDWLLALDSEEEGDEGSILLDEVSEEEGKSDAEVDEDADLSDDDAEDEHSQDEVPVAFDLTEEDLDRLQAAEWDVFMENSSRQVLLDPSPLYDGPSGLTRAAMAYASNPLAIFYFFLPKELWRKIADETNKFRLESVDETAQATCARARRRRETVPSTMVYSVEEYKAKLKRKNAIQPHEIVRFIGLLVARALELRRESLSRHWITKVEGALSRGTFGQFLSRDRFKDIARYLHFNDNSKQAESGDRAFKIRPVLQALQKTFFRGYRLGARISFDEGMVPMRHCRNPMRQYMRMKPNKWGTKFYMTCCAETAYCSRYGVSVVSCYVYSVVYTGCS